MLVLYDYGLFYLVVIDIGIDKDFVDELICCSGCKVNVSLMLCVCIWQLIELGVFDFSLFGIINLECDKFVVFVWYFSNKYYLLVCKDVGIIQLVDVVCNDCFQIGVICGFCYSSNVNCMVDQLMVVNCVILVGGLELFYEVLLQNCIQGMIMEFFDYLVVEEKCICEVIIIISFEDFFVLYGLIMLCKVFVLVELDKWCVLVNGMLVDGMVLCIFCKYFNFELVVVMVEFQSKL